ncbi:hypothetical protein [Pseudoduganella lurida]|uniref:hypothetical protein n=1 Tax=Pseudoduganella lurida TaxID=1036180 RepID=UPI0011A26A87|nr:hypothetical protein [Pseudoduganella lurida]
MDEERRKDTFTARKVEVALVFWAMLGPEDALAYAQASHLDEGLVQRILHTPAHRSTDVPENEV